MDVLEEYGGPSARDYRFNVVIGEELWRAGATGRGFVLHTDIVVTYITNYSTPDQRRRCYCAASAVSASPLLR
jgi:alkylation response protein AidB-like acyl-CoA dehydrogenase